MAFAQRKWIVRYIPCLGFLGLCIARGDDFVVVNRGIVMLMAEREPAMTRRETNHDLSF